ncbi:MAG: type II secretion system protein [Burkholderiales bacterium]
MRIRTRGFTLIELLVVMAIIATLLTLAVPRYFQSVERSKEAVLKENLNIMRGAIDQFHADSGAYPATLEELVTKKYLRKIPLDPITESTTTWVTVAPDGEGSEPVHDVRSAAPGQAKDSTLYGDW